MLLSSALVASSNSRILQEKCQSHFAGLYPAMLYADSKPTTVLTSGVISRLNLICAGPLDYS